jgi:hypothetical protein
MFSGSKLRANERTMFRAAADEPAPADQAFRRM